MRRVLALVIALAACGDDDFNGLPDGPIPPDTTTDGPTEGLVKLTITSGTAPVEGVKVYFQNSDSSMVAAVSTDANGVASAVMEPGGFVTAVAPFLIPVPQGVAGPTLLKTFSGVKPGDELVLHERELSPSTVNITILANPEDSGNVASYQLFAPCQFGGATIPNLGAGSGGVTGGVSLTGCGATTDFTLVGFDVNGQPIQAIHKTNIVLSEGGTVDLTAETYAAVQSATYAWTSVPAGVAQINVTSVLATARGPQFEIFDSVSVDNNMAMTVGRPRPVVADALQITGSRAFGSPFGVHNVIEWGPSTTAYSLAMGDILTPSILINDFSSQPAYDLNAKTVRWTVDATTGRAPDLIVSTVRFQRETPAFLEWEWDIAGPAIGSAEALRYPVLPAPDDQFNPAIGDAFQIVDELMLAKVPGGYDAVRENIFAPDDPFAGVEGNGLVVGATGQIVFEEVLLGKAKREPINAHGVLSPFAQRLDRAHKRSNTRRR